MLNRKSLLQSVNAVDNNIQLNAAANDKNNETVNTVTPIFNSNTLQKLQTKIVETNSGNAVKEKSELKAFFTKDAKLLNDYYDLRALSYSEDWGFDNFHKLETVFDKQGSIVVVLENDVLVGGARLMVSNKCPFLSNETPGTQYEYKQFIKKYDDREDLIIGELSAFVAEKTHRDSRVSSLMFDTLFKEAKSQGCHYVFGVTLPLICRSHRKTLRQVGYDLEIVINYPWEKKKIYNFATMFPIYVKLQ